MLRTRSRTLFLGLVGLAACDSSNASTTGTATSSSTSSGYASSSSSSGAQSSSSGAGGMSSSSSSGAGAGGSGGLGPGVTTISASMGPITIQPGEEAVKCITVGLKNAQGAFVRRFRTHLNPGSHHMIVYKSSQPEDLNPVNCQSFGVLGGSAIFIAQQTQSELVFPTDPNGVPVGLELAANQTLTLEMHYINTTGAPLDILGKVDLDTVPLSMNVIPSGFNFQGAFGIPTIPAQGEADTGVGFLNGIPGTHVFALTTHQHHLGTEMQVWYADGPGDLSNRIADSHSWSDPPLVMFDPPLDFPANGTKGFAYDCHWKNPTAMDVHGGLSANDEMCFFWNYYYPAP